jgi:hypothetical protein
MSTQNWPVETQANHQITTMQDRLRHGMHSGRYNADLGNRRGTREGGAGEEGNAVARFPLPPDWEPQPVPQRPTMTDDPPIPADHTTQEDESHGPGDQRVVIPRGHDQEAAEANASYNNRYCKAELGPPRNTRPTPSTCPPFTTTDTKADLTRLGDRPNRPAIGAVIVGAVICGDVIGGAVIVIFGAVILLVQFNGYA